MTRVANTTVGAIGLTMDPSHLVPAGGHLDVKEADLERMLENNVPLQSYFDSGALVVHQDGVQLSGEAPERTTVVADAIRSLHPSDFAGDGKPKVDAISAALPDGAEKTNAAERDAVWDMMGGKV